MNETAYTKITISEEDFIRKYSKARGISEEEAKEHAIVKEWEKENAKDKSV